MKMDTKIKPPIFIIEKNKFLAKKRALNFSNITNLSTSNSPNKKLVKENSTQISNEIQNESFNQSKVKNVKWTEKEDNLLIECVDKFGVGKWKEMKHCFIGRTRKQIRQRYISNIKIKKISDNINQTISLNSSMISEEEKSEEPKINENNTFEWNDKLDKILLREYFLNKKSWVKISKKIPGSSENSVKNRFYSLLRQLVNKIKRSYKHNFCNDYIYDNKEINNKLILLINKEILGNETNTENDLNNINEKKKMLFINKDSNSEFLTNKSKKRNYSVKILLTFLPELLTDKGIDIEEILNELNQRKNNAAIQIFVIIEKHFNCYKCDNNVNISADAVFENLKNAQTEKLGKVIRNMKLKIMSKYFHRFRYNTLGI